MFTRILIVEPHKGIADLLECALWLFEYHGELDILSCLEEMKGVVHSWHSEHQALPDLLLLDISLREQEGRALLTSLSTWWPQDERSPAVIVMTTGRINQEEYGVPVLHMPFRIRELHSVLNSMSR